MARRIETLRHLGWQPYTVQNFPSWCGHRQEIISVSTRGRLCAVYQRGGGGEVAHTELGADRQRGLSYRLMPQILTERESLEQQRQQLFTRLAGYQAELDMVPVDKRERRESLDWQISRAQKRLAYLEARLASMGTTG